MSTATTDTLQARFCHVDARVALNKMGALESVSSLRQSLANLSQVEDGFVTDSR